MLEFNWEMFLFYFILEPLVFLFCFGWAIGWFKEYRKNCVVVVDFDTLVDVEPIIERAKVWEQNNKDSSFEKYFEAHISEQKPISKGILRALFFQQLGYTLHFISIRPETMRIETAKFLNEWGLRGELYMFNYYSPMIDIINNPIQTKESLYNCVASLKKVVGTIDKHNGMTGVCKIRKSKKNDKR